VNAQQHLGLVVWPAGLPFWTAEKCPKAL